MIMFEFWLGGPYGIQTALCPLGKEPSRLVAKNPTQKFECRLREPRVQVRFMKGMRNSVRVLQRLQPGADLSQGFGKCIPCRNARPAEAL